VRTNFFIWTPDAKFDKYLLLTPYSAKNLGAHLYVRALKYILRWICFEISQISIRSCMVRRNFSTDFFKFSQFLTAISLKNVAPPSNKNENYLAHLKGQSLLKNAENRIKIDQ